MDAVLASVPVSGTTAGSYVYIPLVSALAILAFGLLLRWMMKPNPRRGSRVSDPSQGLLIGVLAGPPPEAERVRRMLERAGVRVTSRAVASRRQVLVWPDDVDRALRLIAADRER